MAFHHLSPILILLLGIQLVESRLTHETLTTTFATSSKNYGDEGTNWAVLVAGSRGYGNYRHQVDTHAFYYLYQLL